MATTTIRQQSSIPTTDHSCEGRNLLAATTATTKPKSHTIPRTQVDHSCEGRNLTTMCRQRRRILGGGMANCSTRHCEIPAYAGMVQGVTGMYRRIRHYRPPPNPSPNCRQPQTQIHQHTPSSHRPFLRRQESIFYKRQRRSILAAKPPMAKRFLPTQEWSAGGMDDCWEILVWAIVAALPDSRFRGNQLITKHLSPSSPPPLLSCEIPGALF